MTQKSGAEWADKGRESEQSGRFEDAVTHYDKASCAYIEEESYIEAIHCAIRATANKLERDLRDPGVLNYYANTFISYEEPLEEMIERFAKDIPLMRYNSLYMVYTVLRNVFLSHNLRTPAGRMYVKGMDSFRKLAWYRFRMLRGRMRWGQKARAFGTFLGYSFLKITSGYGEKILPWFICVVVVISVFGGCQWILGQIYVEDSSLISNDLEGLGQAIYFSVVTFTTLGYGDLWPACWQSKLLSIIETSLGYVMLGVLVSILSRMIFPTRS